MAAAKRTTPGRLDEAIAVARSTRTSARLVSSTFRQKSFPPRICCAWKGIGGNAGEMLCLNPIEGLRKKERHALENCHPGKNEIPVGRIVLVAGLVDVQEEHGAPREIAMKRQLTTLACHGLHKREPCQL